MSATSNFAKKFDLPIVPVVQPRSGKDRPRRSRVRRRRHRDQLPASSTACRRDEAKEKIIACLERRRRRPPLGQLQAARLALLPAALLGRAVPDRARRADGNAYAIDEIGVAA